MHGEIKKAVMWGGRAQPDFKHWWKVWNGETKEVVDFYFLDDEVQLVVVGDVFFMVNPLCNKSLEKGNVQVYHVISREVSNA